MTFLAAIVFILGLIVVVSNAGEAAADSDLNSFDFQQRLLSGGGDFIVAHEESFADHLAQASRRTQYAVACPVQLGQVDYFDISVKITPKAGWNGTCALADQIMLGHDINAILLNYGVGDSGLNDGAIFLAGVCTVPTTTANRRRLQLRASTGFLWTGVGGCRVTMCNPDNGDKRMLTARDKFAHGHRHLVSSWFTNTFKPQLEAKLEAAFATELVPRHRGCLGYTPAIDVTVNGLTLLELLGATCSSSSVGLLDTINFANLALGFTQSVCASCAKIDFSTKGNGEVLTRGAYVSDEWRAKYNFTITAASTNAYTPNGKARIFDTSRPGTTDANGDPDLGSPNVKCGGQGKGTGGEPGKKGANCQPLGNVLIIQESNKPEPDDAAAGGNLTFTFGHPVLFSDIGLMDIEEKTQRMIFTYQNGVKETFTFVGYGDNGVQRVIANKPNVRKLEVMLQGAVVELNFCGSC